VLGVETNCAFLQRLLALPDTRNATFHTRLIDEVLAEWKLGTAAAPLERLAAAAAWYLFDARRTGPGFGAWSAFDVTGWQMHAGDDPVTPSPALLLHSGGRVHEVRFGAVSPEAEVTVQVGSERIRLMLTPIAHGDWRLRVGDRHEVFTIVRRGETIYLQGSGAAHAIGVTSYLSQAAAGRQTSGQLRTPMMGIILKTHVVVGDRVSAGDVVATMESMKMEMRINAEHDGVVRSLLVQPGQMVERGLVVAVVEAEGADESAAP
jgi:3-methylcrotonyl-CoA carboxylase alpha subunit